MTLQELAELVEGAEGPSRELDVSAHFATNKKWIGRVPSWPPEKIRHTAGNAVMIEGRGYRYGDIVPLYTASLDAAMSLVPEGWALASLSYWPASPEGADEQTGPKASAGLVGASLKRFGRRMVWGHTASDGRADGDAATPALALCAASLKALSKREGEDG